MSLLDQFKVGLDKAWLGIADLLQEAEFIKITRSNFDPISGVVSQTSTITKVMVGIVDFDNVTRTGSDIQAGDMRALVRASDLPATPSPGDLLAADGQTWTVIAVRGDLRIVWDLQVRR